MNIYSFDMQPMCTE